MTVAVRKDSTLEGGDKPSRWPAIISLVISLVIVTIISGVGGMATQAGMDWYDQANKVAFNPPKWAFPVAWTLLYSAMAVAAWRVWRLSEGPVRRFALGVYAAKLIANALWSVVFFGLQMPTAGIAVVLMLLGLVIWTGVLFYRIDRLAGMLFVPYVAWVAFASVLNIGFVMVNA